MRPLLASIVVLGALGAMECRAALITWSITNSDGTFPDSTGSVGPLPIDGQEFTTLSTSFEGGSVSFVVQAWNDPPGRRPEIYLYDFQMSSSRPEPVTCTINLVQDYIVAGSASWTGGSGFNGTATFTHSGQRASVAVDTIHELTTLPMRSQFLRSSGPGQMALSAPLEFDPVTPFDSIYRINTTFTVQVTRGSAGTVTVANVNNNFGYSVAMGQIPAPGSIAVAGAALCLFARRRTRTPE